MIIISVYKLNAFSSHYRLFAICSCWKCIIISAVTQPAVLVLHGPVVKGCESLCLCLISHLQALALLSSVGTSRAIPRRPGGQAARRARAEVFVALDCTGGPRPLAHPDRL